MNEYNSPLAKEQEMRLADECCKIIYLQDFIYLKDFEAYLRDKRPDLNKNYFKMKQFYVDKGEWFGRIYWSYNYLSDAVKDALKNTSNVVKLVEEIDRLLRRKALHYGLNLTDGELTLLEERRQIILSEGTKYNSKPGIDFYSLSPVHVVKKINDEGEWRWIGRFQTYFPEETSEKNY